MSKAIKCYRCGKRCRNAEGWNVEYVAGLELGAVCPVCQSSEEDIGAQVNEAMGTTQTMRTGDRTLTTEGFVLRLIETYPNASVMRAKADRLAGARSDEQAQGVAALMHRIADDMESGALYDD